MTSYLFFTLSILFYFCLIFFKPTAGQNDILTGFLLFAFYGIGFISSIILTIKVLQKGGFDWVATQSGTRYIIVAIGWITLNMAIFISLDIEAATEPLALRPFFQWLAKSKSLVWIPLLMLFPYFFIINTNLKATVPSLVYTIPLVIGFTISALMVLSLFFLGLRKKEPLDDSKLSYERAVEKINNSIEEQVWDFTSRNMNERVRKYALEKTKEQNDWEMNMLSQLTGNNRYRGVYAYLDCNSPDHPELFIEPIKNNIQNIAVNIGLSIQGDKNKDEEFFRIHLDVEMVCRALDRNFKNSSAVFRPGMIEVQKMLNKEPLDRYAEIRNKYKRAVNNWLEVNK